ncbi:succinate-semialdehyde dehydrogenase (NADP(+)), partial [Staphylococcus cohnii]
HQSIVDEYTKKLTAKVHELKVGNGMDEGVKVGPLINSDAVAKVLDQVTDASTKGASISRSLDDMTALGGNFLRPVVIANATQDMKVMNEETFGPLAPVMAYDDIDEVIRIANDTPFGLAAYFFTNDYRTGLKFYNELEYGVIGWNDG